MDISICFDRLLRFPPLLFEENVFDRLERSSSVEENETPWRAIRGYPKTPEGEEEGCPSKNLTASCPMTILLLVSLLVSDGIGMDDLDRRETLVNSFQKAHQINLD